MKKVTQLLDYWATQEDMMITYNVSKMILAIHSNARYCNKKNTCSQAGGHFFLWNNKKNPLNKGAILTNATIIKAVMSSAAEAKLGALYLNAKEAVYLCQILSKMGHPQPKTPIQTDNTTVEGVIKIKYSQNAPKHWTCKSIGYVTTKPKDNLKFIGNQGEQTSRIISQSIIHRPTMSMLGQSFS
jgi:hypothetical protein